MWLGGALEDAAFAGRRRTSDPHLWKLLHLSATGTRFLVRPEGWLHDPSLPPRHAYVAFYLWLRECGEIDAMIHLGAHGTLEWLPGKAVALSEVCAPQALIGTVPVIYPFIVNDPGEAAQAKRRISAVTLGHNTPPLIETEPSAALTETERLLDEYAAADGPRQRAAGPARGRRARRSP